MTRDQGSVRDQGTPACLSQLQEWLGAYLGEAHAKVVIEFLKFGTIGFLGFCVDTALVYTGIYEFGMSRIAAGFFAFPFAVTVTWIGNRLFTFRDVEHEPMARQWAKFAVVCGIGVVFNRGTYSLLVSTIPFVYDHPVLGLLGGTAAAMFFNFFGSKKVVFR